MSGRTDPRPTRMGCPPQARARPGAGAVGLALLLLMASAASPVRAQSTGWPTWAPRVVGAQFTLILQNLRPFPAPYGGANSLSNLGDTQGTHTYGLYLGARITGWLQAYLDGEMALGGGVSHATGLGGLTNGDVIRQGSVDLAKAPYVARVFLRALIPVGHDTARVERGPDQLAGIEPRNRVEIKAG